jgi:hypothetical protein
VRRREERRRRGQQHQTSGGIKTRAAANSRRVARPAQRQRGREEGQESPGGETVLGTRPGTQFHTVPTSEATVVFRAEHGIKVGWHGPIVYIRRGRHGIGSDQELSDSGSSDRPSSIIGCVESTDALRLASVAAAIDASGRGRPAWSLGSLCSVVVERFRTNWKTRLNSPGSIECEKRLSLGIRVFRRAEQKAHEQAADQTSMARIGAAPSGSADAFKLRSGVGSV